MNYYNIFKHVLVLGISLLFCCNVKCQSNVSSCKTYMAPRNIIFHPAFFLQRRGLFILSFDYDNNKCLEIVYSTGGIDTIEEYSFKQIGDTLIRCEDYYNSCRHELIKGNRIHSIGADGKVIKGPGLKLINDKTLIKIQQKYEYRFKRDHLIIEDSCIRLDKQQK